VIPSSASRFRLWPRTTGDVTGLVFYDHGRPRAANRPHPGLVSDSDTLRRGDTWATQMRSGLGKRLYAVAIPDSVVALRTAIIAETADQDDTINAMAVRLAELTAVAGPARVAAARGSR
jgi:hypothetical protein